MPPDLIAASTFSAVAGSEVIRTPTASWMALSIAAAVGTEVGSPTPFAPNWAGRVVAVPDFDLDRRHVEAGGHDVVGEIGIDLAARVVEQDFLLQGEPDAHGDPPFDLAFHQHRVDRGAAVVRGGDADDLDLSGLIVNVDLGDLRGVDVGVNGLPCRFSGSTAPWADSTSHCRWRAGP